MHNSRVFVRVYRRNVLRCLIGRKGGGNEREENALEYVLRWSSIRSERIATTSLTYYNRFGRKISANIPLQKKKLVGRRHWIGNEVETSEALEVAGICTNKGRLSFEGAMLL